MRLTYGRVRFQSVSDSARRVLEIHWPILLPAALLGLILHAWFAPGLVVGEDFQAPPIAASFGTLDHSGIWLSSYDMSQGGFNLQAWWTAFPLWAIVGALHGHGVPWDLIERLFWLWPCYIFVLVFPYRFFLRRNVSPLAAAVGTTVFAVNTWTIALIERGHIPAIIAYALMPLVVDAFINVLRRADYRSSFVFALIVTLQMIYEVRYAFLTVCACFILAIVTFFMSPKSYDARRTAIAIFFSFIVLGLVNFYWLAPLFLAPVTIVGGSDLNALAQASGNLSLLNSLALYHPFYHHNAFNNPFAVTPVEAPFLVLTAIAVAGYWWGRHRRFAPAFMVIGLLAVIVVSGPSSSFASAVQFIYGHFLAFAGFRDLTKLMSFIGFANSFGIALAFNRVIAAVRPTKLRGYGIAICCVAVVAVGLLCNDAFNPLRLSNFTTTAVRPEDKALQEFINNAPGNGRVMLFPARLPTIGGSRKHAIYNGAVAGGVPSFGSLLSQQGPLDFYRSTLARQILKEVGAEYFVVIDDPTNAYYTYDYQIGRDEVLKFFDSLPWMRRLKNIGNHVVYAIQGNIPYRVAFYASCPVSTLSDGRSIDVLSQSELRGDDLGIVAGPQQAPTSDLGLLPNAFVAPIALTNGQDQAYGMLKGAIASVRYIGKRYQAFAVTQNAMTTPTQSERVRYLDASWTSPIADRWRVTSQFGQNRISAAPVYMVKLSKRLSEGRSGIGTALIDARAVTAYFSSGIAAGAPGQSYSLTSPSTVNLIDSFDEPIAIDLVLPGLAAQSLFPGHVTVEANGVAHNLAVPGHLGFTSWIPAADAHIQSIILNPGSNTVTLSSPEGGIFVSSEPSVMNPKLLGASVPVETLGLRQEPEKDRLKFIVSSSAASGLPARHRIRLMDKLDIPVTHLPSVDLHYSMSSGALSAYLAYGLADPRLGLIELRQPLHNDQTSMAFDVASSLIETYSAIWDAQVTQHAGDVGWLINNYFKTPDWSGSVLKYVDLVLVKPGVNYQVPESLSLFDVVVSTGRSQTYDGPFESSDQRVNLSGANISLGSGRPFRSQSVARAADILSIDLAHDLPVSMPAPLTLRTGDTVTLQLVNGRTLTGRIISTNSTAILLSVNGQNVQIGRTAIAESLNSSQTAADLITVRIPTDISEDSTQLQFSLNVPIGLSYVVRLGVAGTDSRTIHGIPATNQTAIEDVPASWIRTAPMRSGAVQAIGSITDANPGSMPEESWSVVTLDLNAIYSAQVPTLAAPHLRWIEFHFKGYPVSYGFLQPIQISNVRSLVGSERPQHVRSHSAPLTVDDRQLNWKSAGIAQYQNVMRATTGQLPSGTHYIQTYGPMASTAQSALVENGSAACVRSSPNYAMLNDSEVVGLASAQPGLLIGNMTYDSNWRLAVLPMGTRITGNVLLDFFRAFRDFLPPSNHFVVNGELNGWWIDTKKPTVLMLFMPTAISYMAAIMEIPIIILLVALFKRIVR